MKKSQLTEFQIIHAKVDELLIALRESRCAKILERLQRRFQSDEREQNTNEPAS